MSNWTVHRLRYFLWRLPCTLVGHLLLLINDWSVYRFLDRHGYHFLDRHVCKHVNTLFDGAVMDTSLWNDLRDMNDLLSDPLYWLVLTWLVHRLKDLFCTLRCPIVRTMLLLLDGRSMHRCLNRRRYKHFSNLFASSVRGTPFVEWSLSHERPAHHSVQLAPEP